MHVVYIPVQYVLHVYIHVVHEPMPHPSPILFTCSPIQTSFILYFSHLLCYSVSGVMTTTCCIYMRYR